MPRDFDLPAEPPEHVLAQLLEQGWSGLSALEHAGYLLFPCELYRRRRDGSFERVQVSLRVPRQHELRQARVRARAMATEDGLDPQLDADLLADLETVCLLSVALRSTTPPHEPFEPDARVLERAWDKASLVQAWAKLDALYRVVDPAPSTISDREMLLLIAKLAKERNLGPLAAYGPDARTTFIISMADQLLTFLGSRSSSG